MDSCNHGKRDGLVEEYSVPEQAEKLFKEGILTNSLIAKDLPEDFAYLASKIRFKGSKFPSIPVNWRFAESIASLKGLEGLFINALLVKKYGVPPQEIVIDTDHAQLFIMSAMLFKIDQNGKVPLTMASFSDEVQKPRINSLFSDRDIHASTSSIYRMMATNIYRTKDDRFFHIHGSLNPVPTLDSLGLLHYREFETLDEAIAPYVEAVGRINSHDLQKIASDDFKQAGTICWTTEEYKNSDHGKANSNTGLYEVHHYRNSKQIPGWWLSIAETSHERPLAGLKVVDLSRIIAAPAVSRGLAELGASVMRITAAHLPDLTQVLVDLNWGKWNAALNLRDENDRKALRDLIIDADVVVSGYRPGVMEKYGFGHEDIFDMCKDRERGIIVARENCYGWKGPWSYRSGWQQISDANCGVSMEFGRAMGNNEPVTPVFPNSDYCTGVIGACGIMDAILRRSQNGGSYLVDIALNYYSQWLVNSCGTYPADIWEKVWTDSGRKIFRHYHTMGHMMPTCIETLAATSASKVFRAEYFEDRQAPNLKTAIRTVTPILQFPGGKVKPGYQVGTRGNGVDAAKWPADLMTQVVY